MGRKSYAFINHAECVMSASYTCKGPMWQPRFLCVLILLVVGVEGNSAGNDRRSCNLSPRHLGFIRYHTPMLRSSSARILAIVAAENDGREGYLERSC